MSQLTLTPEEDALVLNALRTQANQYQAMFGSPDVALGELIAKVESQLTPQEAAEDAAPKAKKSKAAAE